MDKSEVIISKDQMSGFIAALKSALRIEYPFSKFDILMLCVECTDCGKNYLKPYDLMLGYGTDTDKAKAVPEVRGVAVVIDGVSVMNSQYGIPAGFFNASIDIGG